MLEEEDLKDAILLVFANKQDMKGASLPLASPAVMLSQLLSTQLSHVIVVAHVHADHSPIIVTSSCFF